jgi:hypothetical protein
MSRPPPGRLYLAAFAAPDEIDSRFLVTAMRHLWDLQRPAFDLCWAEV